jgi:hypothetical protein
MVGKRRDAWHIAMKVTQDRGFSVVTINLFSEHHTGKAVKMRRSPVLASLPKPDGNRTAGRQ